MKTSARVFAIRFFQCLLFFTVTTLLLFPSLSYAQTSQTTSREFYNTVENNVEYDLNTKAQALILGLSNALLCQLSGIDLMNPDKGCLVFNPITQRLGYAPQDHDGNPLVSGGLVGFTGIAIDMMYTQPISSSQFGSYLADNFGITKTAHAQPQDGNGQDARTGFDGLNSILLLFVAFRNIVYVLLILAFVIIGIAIMLRIHIDPRTVMTIQNQIPKLIIAIITITFSYAIAGLLIDATWVFTYFGINTITTAVPSCGTTAAGTSKLQYVATTNLLNNPLTYVQDVFSDADCFFGVNKGIHGIAGNAALTISDALSRSVLELVSLDSGEIGDCDPGLLGYKVLIGSTNTEDCLRYGAFWVIKYFLAAIFLIVLFIAIVIALFKTWFMLLKAYISILLAVIIAPLWMIVGVIPGGGLGFGQWMRHMVSHLAIFPAAALLYTLAAVIASSDAANNPDTAFLPPLIGNPNVADNMGWLIGLGFILLTPDLLNIIRESLKSPQGKYTGNIFGRAKEGNPLASITAVGGFGYSLGGISTISEKLKGVAGKAKNAVSRK